MPPGKPKKAPPRPATARQIDFLAAVVRLTASLERPPSAQEIADELGITRLGARRQLMNLADKGLMRDVPRGVSSGKWALTPAGVRYLEEE